MIAPVRRHFAILLLLLLALPLMANDSIAAKLDNVEDSVFSTLKIKQRFFYGYNFDIYYHHDTQDFQRTNGWSMSIMPEFGYRISPKAQVGLRFGGSYFSQRDTYYTYDFGTGDERKENLLVMGGSWEVTPYGRYRLKTLFKGTVGIWIDLHGYAGMEFPRVVEGNPDGTEYAGLLHSISYGIQLAPLITYQFNRKSTFNLFISIMSLGYSGTTFVYQTDDGGRYHEYSNDIILFSGKLSNLLSSQFSLGLYGVKFGVQKNF
ncbi:MAG: hypothetical protein MJZ75_06590 [Paludibacteraceae bacterium]|nr:hypothetical protein [Paludibacteraceae bacterium]